MRNWLAYSKVCAVILTVLFCHNVFSATLESMRVVDEGKAKELVFKLSGNYQYRVFTLHNPERLVVDFDKTIIPSHAKNFAVANEIVSKVRYGKPSSNTQRIVFDLKCPISFSSSRTVINRASDTLVKVEMQRDFTKTATSKPFIQKPTAENNPSPRPLRDVIVIIDPGHGGKDPGAIGIRNSREKHIVLAIAKKLKKLIDKQPGMRAVLTRNGDYYVGLRERMDIARKHDGDIFVAIHADAFGNHDSHGASVFALSPRGATSEAARWLAEKENYSELGGVDLSSLDDKNDEIRTVLIDLSQTATISASLNMGKSVLSNLDRITSLHSKKVEQARFVVLKSPDIPSVLVETGFISNPKEERNLTSPTYQNQVSRAIFSGIKTYFWNYPPYGSLIEAMAMRNRKIVKR